MTAKPMAVPARNYYLDWLRVIAILCVFLFHSQRFFDPYDWHVKNRTTYPSLTLVANVGGMWAMPLIFVVSGASTYYSIRKNKAGRFLKKRLLRLVAPLAVGIFPLSAIAVYLERVSHHQYAGSFFDWLPRYFRGWYGYGGNFAWMGLHLWYLEVLFIISVLLLPVFSWMLFAGGKKVLTWLGRALSIPGTIYLLAAPVIVLLILIDPQGGVLLSHNFGGWSVPVYIFFFFYGFLLVSRAELQERVYRQRWLSLSFTLAILAILLVLVPGQAPPYGTPRFALVFSLYGVDAWCGVLAMLGFAMKRLSRPTPFMAYANEAVMPFYVIHQPVLLIAGFFVVQLSIPDLLKWVIIAIPSLAMVMGIYEIGIRRVNTMRVLFGMAPLPRQPALRLAKET